MNSGLFQTFLTVGGGIIGGLITYFGTKTKANSDTESVYAHSMPEMIGKVQELLEQLESKNGKIAELTTQVEAQSHTIDALTEQVGKMQGKIDKLTGGQENDEISK